MKLILANQFAAAAPGDTKQDGLDLADHLSQRHFMGPSQRLEGVKASF